MPPHPGSRFAPPLVLRLLLLAALVAVFGYLARNLFIDDALIYARYMRNALTGQGLVFNPGEPVNALSSPLYSYLVLGLSKLLAGRVLAASAIASFTFLFAACALAEAAFPWSGLLVASTAYFYGTVGMETSLFLFLLLLAVELAATHRENWLPAICTLLLLTRFEGGVLIPVLLVFLYRERRWPRPVAFLPAAAIVAVYITLNHHWYGSWLPASAAAKLGQGRSGIWGKWPRAFFGGAYQLKHDFRPELEVVLAVLLLAAIGLWQMRRTDWQRLVLPALAILLAFYVFFNIPGYKWYFAPFIFFAMLYACAAITHLGPRWIWAAPLLVLAGALTTAWHLHRDAAPQNPALNYSGIAAYMEQHAPGHTLEAAEIGTLGWDCPDCRIIDIIGLTTPKNAVHIAHRDQTSWLREDHPDFIVVHYAPWSFEQAAKDSPNYTRVPADFGTVVYLLQRNDLTTPR